MRSSQAKSWAVVILAMVGLDGGGKFVFVFVLVVVGFVSSSSAVVEVVVDEYGVEGLLSVVSSSSSSWLLSVDGVDDVLVDEGEEEAVGISYALFLSSAGFCPFCCFTIGWLLGLNIGEDVLLLMAVGYGGEEMGGEVDEGEMMVP